MFLKKTMNDIVDHEILRNCFTHRDVVGIKSLITTENVKKVDATGLGVVWFFLHHGPDDPEILKLLVDAGAPLYNEYSSGFYTPLIKAAARRRNKCIRALLDMGYPVDRLCTNQTALQLAIAHDNDEGVKILLDAGASLKNLTNVIPGWIKGFMNRHRQTRKNCRIILGLKRARSRSLGCNNGVDILRMIARCVWETRGHDVNEKKN